MSNIKIYLYKTGEILLIVEKMDFRDNTVTLKNGITGRSREMFAAKQFLKTMHLVD